MDANSELGEATLVEKVVLLGTVCCGADDEPARGDEVRQACNERLDAVTGRLSEGDVSRALNVLTEMSFLESRRPDDRSPVGKGRPSYVLTTGCEPVLDALGGDDRLDQLVESVRDDLE